MQSEERSRNSAHVGMPAALINMPAPTRPTTVIPADASRPADVEAARQAWMTFLAAGYRQPIGRVLYCLIFKRLLDVLAASILLVMLGPLMALIALVIRLEAPGQVIFRQQRIGRGGEPFTIYKFRTMIPDRRRRSIPIDGVDRRKRHKTQRDPRVTVVGRVLRRTSLDELPQLYNVLKGDMSFIGPRPELPQIVARYEEWQHQRHIVRPGLSGWWQVEGRSDLPMHEHTELDIYYVVNQSLLLDARIVLRTFRALITRGGAF